MSERVGLFGGSFDPIHWGHIRPVLAARDVLSLDRVVYLPTAQPPHKIGRDFAPALARYAMVEIALLDEPGLVVSDHEMTAKGPTYTIDTVKHFSAEDRELFLVIGEDSYVELDTWRRWRELFELARLVVLERPGFDRDTAPEEVRAMADRFAVHWLEHELVDVSSTQVRRALAEGDAKRTQWVPPPVLDYCSKYALYR